MRRRHYGDIDPTSAQKATEVSVGRFAGIGEDQAMKP